MIDGFEVALSNVKGESIGRRGVAIVRIIINIEIVAGSLVEVPQFPYDGGGLVLREHRIGGPDAGFRDLANNELGDNPKVVAAAAPQSPVQVWVLSLACCGDGSVRQDDL